MIVLDTNVVSEFMTAPPAASVLAWLNAQNAADVYLTSISIAEICYGLQAMPKGRRGQLLVERFEQFLTRAFESRILSFDQDAARAYGEIRGQRRALGRPMSNFDGQIAAIARTRGFGLATRNTKDFEDCGLELINPFQAWRSGNALTHTCRFSIVPRKPIENFDTDVELPTDGRTAGKVDYGYRSIA